MHRRKRTATIALAAVCALVGAAAGIAESSAATKAPSRAHLRHGGFAGVPGGPGRHAMAVHSTEVVLNKAGTAYITETEDSGTVTAVDPTAGTITLKEGTGTVSYATPTLTIPSGSTVLLDGKTSSLEKILSGDHVSVRSSSEGTTVFAADSSFTPGWHGPGGPGGPPGPGPGPWG